MSLVRIVAALALVTGLSAALIVPPASPAQPAPDAGAGQPEFSLEDLDALLEEDELEESVASLSGAEIGDIVGMALVLGFAVFSFMRKSVALKYVSFAASIAYLGFYKSNLVSIVNIFAILEGNFPDVRHSIAWYLLIGFTAVSTVLWGRLYCGRICAFGAFTQLLDRIVPARLRFDPPPRLDRRLAYLKYVILGAVLLYFLASSDFLVYRYVEPFWMFTLNGNVVMWTLLGTLLLATIVIRNLYCRYLCSVGAALGLISNLTVFKIKRWQECQGCKICEKACEWGAIDGPTISLAECVRCDDCERLYHDEQKCVHWLILHKKPKTQPAAS
ncbi:MAG: 4Fe-4S binding protein [Dehalococcoidia bacterium]|nr:4Fe-4S binding protein [Dehalococcoidia bacterium]